MIGLAINVSLLIRIDIVADFRLRRDMRFGRWCRTLRNARHIRTQIVPPLIHIASKHIARRQFGWGLELLIG